MNAFHTTYLEQLQCGLWVGSTKSQSPVLSDSSSQVPLVKVVNFLLLKQGRLTIYQSAWRHIFDWQLWFCGEMTLNILVPCTVNVVLLPHRLHHLAGKPAGDFTPMKSVVRAVAIGRRGQLEPPLGKLIIYGRQKHSAILLVCRASSW